MAIPLFTISTAKNDENFVIRILGEFVLEEPTFIDAAGVGVLPSPAPPKICLATLDHVAA